ncbi:MAG TPA: ATP-binding protein, partial [Actinomycetes bacterium]|nr:ATP-binding protein [Actinomycetes bacterium]
DLREISGSVRARAGVGLPVGVELATPEVPWGRLVLPEEPASQLGDAVARLHHQSRVLNDWGFLDGARADRGVRLLFTGPPGTGKSLAAEVMATAVGTDLLVVDVSRVVSKWIGETEKNLAGIFDAAERTQAVLLLDEADALFGMRTEISDAHDRYANLETAYLLQRLDRFDGLAVLTTNLRNNVDPAFVRRMDFVVEFGLPDEPRREQLWRLHLPEPTLADDVRVDLLARLYPVPGGWIRNAAIAAAFLAAPMGGPIRQHHLVRAMRREYAKAMRPFPGEPLPAGGRAPHSEEPR